MHKSWLRPCTSYWGPGPNMFVLIDILPSRQRLDLPTPPMEAKGTSVWVLGGGREAKDSRLEWYRLNNNNNNNMEDYKGRDGGPDTGLGAVNPKQFFVTPLKWSTGVWLSGFWHSIKGKKNKIKHTYRELQDCQFIYVDMPHVLYENNFVVSNVLKLSVF